MLKALFYMASNGLVANASKTVFRDLARLKSVVEELVQLGGLIPGYASRFH